MRMRKSVVFRWFIFGSAAIYLPLIVVFQIDIMSLSFSARKQKLLIVKRYYANRTGKHCDVRFDWGEMCPKLYTELGGRCDLVNATFDCPDIRNKTQSTVRQAQLVMTRMLRIFHLLAQKHDLAYWLGFISWDNDVDIFMPLEDYITFFQSVAKELPKDIFFQNVVSDPPMKPDDTVIAVYWFTSA